MFFKGKQIVAFLNNRIYFIFKNPYNYFEMNHFTQPIII